MPGGMPDMGGGRREPDGREGGVRGEAEGVGSGGQSDPGGARGWRRRWDARWHAWRDARHGWRYGWHGRRAPGGARRRGPEDRGDRLKRPREATLFSYPVL